MAKAYHFLCTDFRANDDEQPWKVGETRTLADTSRIQLYKYGYHSSPNLWDALQHADGPVACLVEISEPIEQNETRYVSASRTLLKAVNIDSALRLFACDCAERVLPLYERAYPDDMRPRNCINTSRRFALGRATKKERDVAWDAATDAAWYAATTDESVIAKAAAWAAAAAASNTAKAAAWDAAWAATNAAATNVAWAADVAKLQKKKGALCGTDAARGATKAAAKAAVKGAEVRWQRTHFNGLCEHIFDGEE